VLLSCTVSYLFRMADFAYRMCIWLQMTALVDRLMCSAVLLPHDAMFITSTVDICIQQLGRVEEIVFTARRSYASAVVEVVILSVCLSHACFVTYPKNLPAMFLYHMKGQSF